MTSWTAAVDIGSVAAKLLLTDGTDRIRHSVDTMLGGTQLSAIGEARREPLGPEGLGRLERALGEFRELVDRYRPSGLRVVTTAPGRWPENAAALAALVERHLGVPLEVLDGATEARLSFLGACSDPALVGMGPGRPADGGPKVVTVDIGGGSTEFASAGPGPFDGADHAFSVPIGGRSITAAYLGSDPPRAEELSAALSVIELHVDDLRRERPELVSELDTALVLGLGAVTTVAAIEVGLADGDPNCGTGNGPLHGTVLFREAVEDVFRTIATERRADRVFNPGLPSTRADEIVGAVAVLVEIMRQLGLSRIVVSQRGLLDGVLAGLKSPGVVDHSHGTADPAPPASAI